MKFVAQSRSKLQKLMLAGAFTLVVGELVAAGTPPFITAAVNDARRPAADRALDVNRKPAELLSFFQIKPGQKVAELLPGDGYFTRILSKAVGSKGKIYILGTPGAAPKLEGVLGSREYANVRAVTASAASLNLPEQIDVVWSTLSYHELKDADKAAFNRAVYQALKPGGYYVIVDHSANAGDANAPSEKHRIDQLVVVNEVASAGFLKQSEIQALRHPEDPRSANAESMNGMSDRFAMLFRKPDLTFGGAIRE